MSLDMRTARSHTSVQLNTVFAADFVVVQSPTDLTSSSSWRSLSGEDDDRQEPENVKAEGSTTIGENQRP
jgi:hypothetical protein